jgi:hypothetical protein
MYWAAVNFWLSILLCTMCVCSSPFACWRTAETKPRNGSSASCSVDTASGVCQALKARPRCLSPSLYSLFLFLSLPFDKKRLASLKGVRVEFPVGTKEGCKGNPPPQLPVGVHPLLPWNSSQHSEGCLGAFCMSELYLTWFCFWLEFIHTMGR